MTYITKLDNITNVTLQLSETVPHGNREPTSVQLFFQQQTEEYLDPGKKTNLEESRPRYKRFHANMNGMVA